MMCDLLGDMQISRSFLLACTGLAMLMLIWDTVEVGRNDAANLVNAVFGARILPRRTAVWVAGFGVILGAYLSSDVIDTARKGIFDPLQLQQMAYPLVAAFSVYIAVYIVDTVLLYSYSAFGMPMSTTACLVFELLGASFALGLAGNFAIVEWKKAGIVMVAIIFSILISGIAGFLIQRIVRGAIRDRCSDLKTLFMHGGWVAGGMLTGLIFFMLTKGMKNITPMQDFFERILTVSDDPMMSGYWMMFVLFMTWIGLSAAIHVLLIIFQHRAARLLFPCLAIVGMVSMGFAFGQNDLANCASPGLAAWNLYKFQDISKATRVDVASWILLGCGILLVLGMTTRNAQRVTRAEVHTGSMSNTVALYAPRWCIRIARFWLKIRKVQPTLAPPPLRTPADKQLHYDPLRACVILSVSASVIATASSFGLPVSTTYVAFAAVVATGAADRIMQRGDAELKIARAIWVIFSWFAASFIAAVAAGLVCLGLYYLGVVGLILGVGTNMTVRIILKKRADTLDTRVRESARERRHPEQFTEFDG